VDALIALLGLLMLVGAVLIFSEFSFSNDRRERVAAIGGFVCMGLGGLGAIVVGSVPENLNTAHLQTVRSRVSDRRRSTRHSYPWVGASPDSQSASRVHARRGRQVLARLGVEGIRRVFKTTV